ncbi:MAG: 4-hydroxyphenylpyruvate dioxygenase, partial [Bacteroidota bacterium]
MDPNTLDLPKLFTEAQDFMPLYGTDYVELYVSNSKQAAYFYKTAFGFQDLAYAGLETGVKDRESYVLQQDKIRLVLTSPLKSGTDIGKHIEKHGDGVKVVALWVPDAANAYSEAIKRGAKSYLEPVTEEDATCKI